MKQMLVYLFLINAAGFLLMLTDKQKAKKNKWRIPEATLLGAAVIGGSLGILIGMHTARHKTLRPRFAVGVPILFTLQVILLICLYLM